jgi:DNA invertase Pin-like site-specific DNA recombinase
MEVVKKTIKLETVHEYASRKGITVQAVYWQIKKGRIKSKKFGSVVMVVS